MRWDVRKIKLIAVKWSGRAQSHNECANHIKEEDHNKIRSQLAQRIKSISPRFTAWTNHGLSFYFMVLVLHQEWPEKFHFIVDR